MYIVYILPAKWIRQAGRNGTRDEHKHIDRTYYVKQICLYFLKEHLISIQFFEKYTLVLGPCFKVNVY